MKKILSVLMIALFACSLSYAGMTDQQIARKMKILYECKAEINTLAEQRQAEEEAIVVEYKVRECNQKRQEMINRYQAQVNAVYEKIADAEKALGEK